MKLSSSHPRPVQSLAFDEQRKTNAREMDQQLEEEVRRIHKQVGQSYEVQLQKMHLKYKNALLEDTQRRHEERERRSAIKNDLEDGRTEGILIVTIPKGKSGQT